MRSHKTTNKAQDDTSLNFSDIYELGPMIGNGGFGGCFSCRHIATKAPRAVKVLHKSKNDKAKNKQCRQEYDVLKQLDHYNCVKVYEMFEDEKYFVIVSDIYEGGDLFDVVKKFGPLSEGDAAIVVSRNVYRYILVSVDTTSNF